MIISKPKTTPKKQEKNVLAAAQQIVLPIVSRALFPNRQRFKYNDE